MTRRLYWLASLPLFTLPALHPFGSVRQPNGPSSAEVPLLMQKACGNCHSEQTQWPLYSYLPVVSWALEKDVAEARSHMNFSRWNQYTADEKRALLARIGVKVRNREMPLPRYLLLHPEDRLTDAQIQTIIEWTKTERRSLRNRGE